MRRWVEQRSAWQYFIMVWPFMALGGAVGAMTAAWPDLDSLGINDLKFITFYSLLIAAGGTLGFHLGKPWRRRHANPDE